MEGKDLFFKNGNSNINSLWSDQRAVPFRNSISEEQVEEDRQGLLFSRWGNPLHRPNTEHPAAFVVVAVSCETGSHMAQEDRKLAL